MAFNKGFTRKASDNAQKCKGGRSYASWRAADSQEAAKHYDDDVPPADQANNDVTQDVAAGINMPPVAQAAAAIDKASDTIPEDKTVAKKRRNDDKWRVKRAVVAVSKQLAKEKENSHKLKGKIPTSRRKHCQPKLRPTLLITTHTRT